MSGRRILARRTVLTAMPALLARPRRSGAQAAVNQDRPYQADQFVESVGINVHLSSPPYSTHAEVFATLAGALGIRHLRDLLQKEDDLQRWRDLHARFGIQSHLLVSPVTNTIADMMAYVGALGTDRVRAIEGQNEGDSPWFAAQPQAKMGWAGAVTEYQRAVFTALRGQYAAEALPILSPSVLDYQPASMRQIRGAARYCDVVAVHAYMQGGLHPETDQPYAAIPWYLREFSEPFKSGAPVMSTETGYHNSVRGHKSGVSAEASAKYLPRLLLHGFSLGLTRSFIYEFMDEGTDPLDTEQNFGIVRVDGTPKPAYGALKRLIAALSDRGPAFVPMPLTVTAAGVRCVPFQKRGGDVVLALWRAAQSWDPDRRRDVPSVPGPVRVGLSRAFATAAALSLAGGEWAPVPLRPDGFDAAVSDTVTLVQLTA